MGSLGKSLSEMDMDAESQLVLNRRERVSALMDGAFDVNGGREALHELLGDRDAVAHWRAYHVIGDVLRSPSSGPRATRRDPELAHRVMAALEREVFVRETGGVDPAAAGVPRVPNLVDATHGVRVVRPQADEAANASRWRLVAGVASLFAVAAVVWSVAGARLTDSSAPVLASGGAAAGAAERVQVGNEAGVMIRDPRLDELLAAHRQFGGNSALQMPSGFLRNATFDAAAR